MNMLIIVVYAYARACASEYVCSVRVHVCTMCLREDEGVCDNYVLRSLSVFENWLGMRVRAATIVPPIIIIYFQHSNKKIRERHRYAYKSVEDLAYQLNKWTTQTVRCLREIDPKFTSLPRSQLEQHKKRSLGSLAVVVKGSWRQ